MIVTYAPAGQEPQVWTWEPAKVRGSEAELIEEQYGDDWDVFTMKLLSGQMRARRFLLWHLLRTQHPTIRASDVDFTADELKLELEPSELQKLREGVENAAGVSDAKRQVALDLIDQQIVEAGGVPGKVS